MKNKKFILLLGIMLLISVSFVSATLLDDLVFYYRLDETTGTEAEELVDGINNITSLANNWTSGIIENGHWLTAGETPAGGFNMTQFGVNWTMNFWANRTGAMVTTNGRVFESLGDQLLVRNPGTTSLEFRINDIIQATFTLELGSWYMFTMTRNHTGVGFFVNGTLESTTLLSNDLFTEDIELCFFSQRTSGSCIADSPTNLIIDETGFWNKTLSSVEVEEIYKNGGAKPYPFNVNVSLNSPANDTLTASVNITFNATIQLIDGTGFNITNATFRVWYTNGTIINETTIDVTDPSNVTTLDINLLPLGELMWNVEGCVITRLGESSLCDSSPVNRTLTISHILLAEFFNNQTTEGNIELFQVNITIPTSRQITNATLIYNNTGHSDTTVSGITDETDNFSISKFLEIENVLNDVSLNFSWNITYDSGFNFAIGKGVNNQSVKSLSLDSCGTNTIVVINYTIRDEKDRTLLAGGGDNVTIEVELDLSPLGTTDPIVEFNQTFNFVNSSISICINEETMNNSEFRMDVLTKYEAFNHVSEFHHIQNFTLKNSTIYQNITLHDLNTSQSQEFLITFKGDNFLPISNALIDITRKYIGDGIFRSVEVPKTDSNGETIGHLVLGDVIYTFIVKKEGTILGTFDNIVAFCDNQATGDCKINLNVFGSTIPPEDFSTSDGVAYTLTFNSSSRDIKSVFSIDGSSATISLNATVFEARLNTTICTDSLTSSFGTLICNVPDNFGNVSVYAELLKNSIPIANKIFTIKQSAAATFGPTRIIMAMILFMTLPLMALTSGAAAVVLGILGLIAAAMLNLYESGGFFGVGATILWAVIMAGVILWKISQR